MSDPALAWRAPVFAAACVLGVSGSVAAQSQVGPVSPGALSVGGYLQIDAVAYNQGSEAELSPAGVPLNETRFTLRRGRVALGYARGMVGGALQIDVNTLNGPAARPINAELSLILLGAPAPGEPQRLRASLGLIKIPFGREVVEPEQQRFFLERSNAAQALFPGVWDLGARIDGGWRAFRYAFAVLNGEPIGEASFPGRDPNQAKDLLGRLGVDVARGVARIEGGASGLRGRGFHRGTPATKDTLVWRDVNEDGLVQDTEIQVIAGSAASPSHSFDRFALGGDLRITLLFSRLWPLELTGEVTWASNLDRGLLPSDPLVSGRNLRQLGYYLGVVQGLTRHASVGVRYDWYQPDADATERHGANLVPRNGRFATLAVAAAWIHGPSLRVVVQYDRNWNALGRFPSGFPRTLGRDALTLRGQLVF